MEVLYEAVSSELHFPSLKEVSQDCFVFDLFRSCTHPFFEEVLLNCPVQIERKVDRSIDRRIDRQIDSLIDS